MRYEFKRYQVVGCGANYPLNNQSQRKHGDHAKATHPRMKRQEISRRQPCSKKQEDCEKPIINYQGVRNTLSARITFYCQVKAD